MINLNLFRRLALRGRFFLLTCAATIAVFELLICAAVSTINVQAVGAQLLATLPPFVQATLGQQMLSLFTPAGLLAFGWNHPITIALGAAVAIATASRAIAGEVESGAIELVLAQPISRSTYLATHLAFGFAALAFITLGGLVGSYIGQIVWKIPLLRPAPAFALGFCFWLLNAACFGFALMASAFAREAGRAAGVAFVLVLASYLIQAVGRFWHRAAFLLPWSIYERFTPRVLLATGHVPADALAVLGGLLVVATAIAWLRFARRDLP